MIKVIRILEVPLLLMLISIGCIEEGLTRMSIFLIAISVTRLVINVMTDDIIYKR